MCWLTTPKQISQVSLSVKSWREALNMLAAVGIDPSNVPARDDYVWFPSYNDWIEIIKGAHASAPAYRSITATQPGFDCDKFARHLADYAAINYLINSCWEVWGHETFSTPPGYHGWNIILTEDAVFEVEPQTADIWLAGTNQQYETKTIYFVSARVPKNK